MSVAFNGMDHLVVTFKAGVTQAGDPVSMSENETVGGAKSGESPVGIALNLRNNHAAVLVKGYTEVKYSGGSAPKLGWNSLVADGSSGLRLAASGETGRTCLVVSLNTTDKIMGLFL